MKGGFQYQPEYDALFRMPQGMLPPPAVYRYVPPRMYQFWVVANVVHGNQERMIFEGSTVYSKEEYEHLTNLLSYMRDNNLVCNDMYEFLYMLEQFLWLYDTLSLTTIIIKKPLSNLRNIMSGEQTNYQSC